MLKIKNNASWAKALLLFTMLFLGACQKHDFALQSSEIVFTKDVSNVAQWYNSQLIPTTADTGFASLNKPDWTKTTVKQVGGTSTFTTPVYTNGAISRDVIIELTGEVYTGVVKEYKKVDKYFTTVHTYSINGKPIEEGYINATNNYHVTKTWQKNSMGSTLRVMDIGDEYGGGGSGNGGALFDITNQVKNVCLKDMVNAVINKSITTVINTLIQKVFGGSNSVNLFYSDDVTLQPGVMGYTPPVAPDEYGVINLAVHLDSKVLPTYSQEYIAATIMHESIHAYLATIGSFKENQHIAIMTVFVTQMAVDLKKMFPNIPDNDAKNLALGGLFLTPDYIAQIGSNIQAQGSFDATELAYTTGSLGTRCNK